MIFGLGAAFGWGLADFGAAAAGRRIGSLRTVTLAQLSGFLVIAVVLFVVRPAFDLRAGQVLVISANGVLTAVAYFALYRGLEHGPLSVVSPVVAAYAVVAIALSVLVLHESLSPLAAAGAAVTVVGAVLTSADLRTLRSPEIARSRGVPWAILATVTFGFATFTVGWFSRRWGALPVLGVSRLSTLLVFLVASVLVRGGSRRDGRALWIAVLTGLMDILGLLSYARGAQVAALTIVSAVSSTFPLISVAGGILTFHERPAPNQLLGVVLVVSGLVVLGASG